MKAMCMGWASNCNLQTLFIKVVPGQSFLRLCLCCLRRVFFCKKYRAEFRGCERTVQHLYAVVCMWPAKHRLCSGYVLFSRSTNLAPNKAECHDRLDHPKQKLILYGVRVRVRVCVPPASEKWRSGSHGWPGAPFMVALVVTPQTHCAHSGCGAVLSVTAACADAAPSHATGPHGDDRMETWHSRVAFTPHTFSFTCTA